MVTRLIGFWLAVPGSAGGLNGVPVAYVAL